MDAYIDGLLGIAKRCNIGEHFNLDTPVVQRMLGISEADLLEFVRTFEERLTGTWDRSYEPTEKTYKYRRTA
jgi:hypothetical protein